jgi:hypothetical protein
MLRVLQTIHTLGGTATPRDVIRTDTLQHYRLNVTVRRVKRCICESESRRVQATIRRRYDPLEEQYDGDELVEIFTPLTLSTFLSLSLPLGSYHHH